MEISRLIKQVKITPLTSVSKQIKSIPQGQIPVEATEVLNQNRRLDEQTISVSNKERSKADTVGEE